MAVETNKLCALPVLLLLCYVAAASTETLSEEVGGDDDNCVYTIFIETGDFIFAGTDSNISLSLAGSDGLGIEIKDLARWGGLMGEGHVYFGRANLDIFSGRGRCLSSPPCLMNLTSDGAGLFPEWYCKNVEVTVTGPYRGCFQRYFKVEQWLATYLPPFDLKATRNECLVKADAFADIRFPLVTGPRELGTAERD